MRFLQNEINNEENAMKKSFTYIEVVEMLTKYTERFDDELEDLVEEGKNTNREIELSLVVKEEKQKLLAGYDAPDLRQNKVVTRLRNWEGDVDGVALLNSIKAKFKSKPLNALMDLKE